MVGLRKLLCPWSILTTFAGIMVCCFTLMLLPDTARWLLPIEAIAYTAAVIVICKNNRKKNESTTITER